jgi:hypothetical protein
MKNMASVVLHGTLVVLLLHGSACTVSSQLVTLSYSAQVRSMDCTESSEMEAGGHPLTGIRILSTDEQQEAWSEYLSANSVFNLNEDFFSVGIQTVRWVNGTEQRSFSSPRIRLDRTKQGIETLLDKGLISAEQASNLTSVLTSKSKDTDKTNAHRFSAGWEETPYIVNGNTHLSVLELTVQNTTGSTMQVFKDSLMVVRGDRRMNVYTTDDILRSSGDAPFRSHLLFDIDMGPKLVVPPGQSMSTWVGFSPIPLGTQDIEVYYGSAKVTRMTCRSEVVETDRGSEEYFVESASWNYDYANDWIIFATRNAGEVWYNEGVLYLREDIGEGEPIQAVYYDPEDDVLLYDVFTYQEGRLRCENYKAVYGLQRLTNKLEF